MDKPTLGADSLSVFTQLLAHANEFKTQCPKILLGQNGTFCLDMEIIGNLTLLNKLQINPNDIAHYQLCLEISAHIEKLKIQLKETGEDHLQEYQQLTQAAYYMHLETIKQNMTAYQETTFSHLHSARHLITALKELKKFDPKEHGALQLLLTALEKTFNEKNMRADDKLKIMIQQISDAHDAIKKTVKSPMTMFGAKQKPNPLTPAFEFFIQEEMAVIARTNGITPPGIIDERAPLPRPGNTSTNP